MKLRIFIFGLCFLHYMANAQKVIGGNDVQSGEFPFMAAIISNSTDLFEGYKCGASLIRPNWMLTAAHCVEGEESIEVLLGTNSLLDMTEETELIPVEEVFIHPQFYLYDEFDFDIALLKLTYPSSKTPIEISFQDDESYSLAETNCKVIGWGLKDTNTYSHYHYLQKADVKVIGLDICNDENSYNSLLTSNMLCAGVTQKPLRGVAIGDSGSPLLIEAGNQYLQIGVVMGGYHDWSTIQFPGVFQKTSKHRMWIDSTIMANQIVTQTVEETTLENLLITYVNQHIEISQNGNIISNLSVAIYDLSGKKVEFYNTREDEKILIDISNLRNGVYFLTIINSHKLLKTIKILKNE